MQMRYVKLQTTGIFHRREELDKQKNGRFCNKAKEEGNFVIADFICPTPKARSLFPADYVVWVDTIQKGRFEDTNQMFIKPEKYDFHVTSQDAKNWAPKIFKDLNK